GSTRHEDDDLFKSFFSLPEDWDPSFEDQYVTGSEFAAAMLTGSKPRADLLPRKGSQVAPVATLLGETGDERTTGGAARDQEGNLKEFLINPAADFTRRLVFPHGPVPVKKQVANSGSQAAAAVDRVFEQIWLREKWIKKQTPEISGGTWKSKRPFSSRLAEV